MAWFLEGGAQGAAAVHAALTRHGRDLESCAPVLDFGCGCGRVTRHWAELPSGSVSGVDINEEMIKWCRRSLRFATFDVNDPTPPLRHPDANFGLVYSFSVLTHLPGEVQEMWWAELARVVRPGGMLVLSTHGDWYRGQLDEDERSRFDAGELVVKRDDSPGHNVCGVYHPESYVRRVVAQVGMRVLDFVPRGAQGSPFQDLWVLEKTR